MIITPEIQKFANSVARKHGHGTATSIVFDKSLQTPIVISHVQYGYRKNTTGEYVPNAYRKMFGWKNTYYQNAETTIGLPA